jgi:hypothetical protein
MADNYAGLFIAIFLIPVIFLLAAILSGFLDRRQRRRDLDTDIELGEIYSRYWRSSRHADDPDDAGATARTSTISDNYRLKVKSAMTATASGSRSAASAEKKKKTPWVPLRRGTLPTVSETQVEAEAAVEDEGGSSSTGAATWPTPPRPRESLDETETQTETRDRPPSHMAPAPEPEPDVAVRERARSRAYSLWNPCGSDYQLKPLPLEDDKPAFAASSSSGKTEWPLERLPSLRAGAGGPRGAAGRNLTGGVAQPKERRRW